MMEGKLAECKSELEQLSNETINEEDLKCLTDLASEKALSSEQALGVLALASQMTPSDALKELQSFRKFEAAQDVLSQGQIENLLYRIENWFLTNAEKNTVAEHIPRLVTAHNSRNQ
jgi:hypothetical protein